MYEAVFCRQILFLIIQKANTDMTLPAWESLSKIKDCIMFQTWCPFEDRDRKVLAVTRNWSPPTQRATPKLREANMSPETHYLVSGDEQPL